MNHGCPLFLKYMKMVKKFIELWQIFDSCLLDWQQQGRNWNSTYGVKDETNCPISFDWKHQLILEKTFKLPRQLDVDIYIAMGEMVIKDIHSRIRSCNENLHLQKEEQAQNIPNILFTFACHNKQKVNLTTVTKH